MLEVNGEDILGLRIAEVAKLVRAKPAAVTLLLWTSGADPRCAPESLCCGPMPLNLDRLSSCLQAILVALECPVCLDTILPPAVQCGNGHLVCARCRSRQGADKCAVCRQRYSVTGGGATGGAGAGANRSLIAEQVYGAITEAFRLRCNAGDSYRVGGNGESSSGRLREQLFGAQCRKRAPAVENMKAVQSHTHKFLARIMGKATSLDGLNRTATGTSSGTSATVSTAMGTDRIERDEVTKQLSLSVNEIFRLVCRDASNRIIILNRLFVCNLFCLEFSQSKQFGANISVHIAATPPARCHWLANIPRHATTALP